jgi:hypothetical protein
VVVIAPQKSGTHLIQELFVELGYASVGSIKQDERTIPRFDRVTRQSIAKVVYDDAAFARCESAAEDEFERLTDRAWDGMLYGWYQRFGQPVLGRYGASRHQDPAAIISAESFYSSPFAATPPRIAWYWHQLVPGEFDGQFTNEWYAGDGPPVLLNVRDPRDCLVSIINFMEGKTARGFGNFSERQIFNRILSTCDTWDQKIEAALTDPHFPGATEFEDIIWLWRHPDVLSVRYEDLVGPEGGGTAGAQLDAVKRILEHVQSDADPIRLAQRIYSENSWSFFSGKQGEWRAVFSARMRTAFAERHGSVLEILGYQP